MNRKTPKTPQSALLNKWVDMWGQFENAFAALPKWAQEITLDDISTAVQNRIVVMQKAAQHY